VDLGLQGRVAIVTGGSRGIGRAIAEALGCEGASVVVTYRHDAERANAVAESIRRSGREAMVAFVDLGSQESIVDAAKLALARWGRIDVLVNNAVQWADYSVSRAPLFEDLPTDAWRTPLRSNIEGAYTAIQAVLPPMRKQHWGRIVNVTAVAAVDGLCGAAWYTAAKAAAHGLTRTLARELGADGILVNAVMPGLTQTEHTLKMIPEQLRDEIARSTPIGRLLSPEDVAAIVVFLASAANTVMTGEIVRASGGFTIPHRPVDGSPAPRPGAESAARTEADGSFGRTSTPVGRHVVIR
jgi:3-oxoacyl-[acyl-carrier protein] reductase